MPLLFSENYITKLRNYLYFTLSLVSSSLVFLKEKLTRWLCMHIKKPGMLNSKGFTLAELLICLMILGEIATFTIPKVIASQQRQQSNTAAKEALAMVSGAFLQAQMNGLITTSAGANVLTPYMNYISIQTSGQLDDHVNANGTKDCSTMTCLKLHSGGVLFWPNQTFQNTASNYAVLMFFDPDGVKGSSGSADGPSKSLGFYLYYNGRTSTRALMPAGTYENGGAASTNTQADPSWFSL